MDKAHKRVDALYEVWGTDSSNHTGDASVAPPFNDNIGNDTRRELEMGASQSTHGTTWLTVRLGKSWHGSYDIWFSPIDKSI